MVARAVVRGTGLTPTEEWVVKLSRRLLSLERGRFMIVLTVSGQEADWTVTDLGKVER